MSTDYTNHKVNSSMDDEIDILKLLSKLFVPRHIAAMVVAGIIMAVAAFSYSKFVLPELYTSQVSLYLNNSTVTGDQRGYYNGYSIVDMTSLATSRNLADSYVIILSNNEFMELIGEEMLKIYSPEELSNYFYIDEKDGKPYIKGKYIQPCVSAEPVEETEILEITVTTQNPELSTNMCNAIVKKAPEFLPTIANGGAVEPIGSASIPDEKSYPNNTSNALKGLAAGVLAVIVLLVIRILLDNKIRNTESFKDKFDLPVLGEVPLVNADSDSSHNKKKKNKKQTDLTLDSFQVNEAFNSLCNNLLVTMSMNDEKIIVVSSPEMSDGKSTVCVKLAKSMANMGNKVLLMDLDLRRPSIHKKLDVANKQGFINLLNKNENIDKFIIKDVVSGLDVLLSGGVSPNPSEMLSSKRTKDLIESFKERYDYIIIDSPPVNVVTDSGIISQMAAGIMVVVRADETRFDDFGRTVENIEITRTKIVGVVINGVSEFSGKFGKRYGNYKYSRKYGYRYGYGYGYGYGYAYEKKDKNDNKDINK